LTHEVQEIEKNVVVKADVENERCVKLNAQIRTHNYLKEHIQKEHHENENARAVEEARAEALQVNQKAARKARQEHNRHMEKLRGWGVTAAAAAALPRERKGSVFATGGDAASVIGTRSGEVGVGTTAGGAKEGSQGQRCQ